MLHKIKEQREYISKVYYLRLFSRNLIDFITFAAESLFYQTVDIAKDIKERRSQLGISQQDLAEISEVSLATIKDIERGKGNPSLTTLEKIADVLGMEVVLQIKQMV